MLTKPVLWSLFGLLILGAMAIDLGLTSHRQRKTAVSLGEAARWTLIWIALALGFGLAVYAGLGHQRALEYFTAYLVEESLSVDNMFIFILIFKYFAVPGHQQPRILKWGIFGAIVMRFVLIFAGVSLVQRFEWLFYIFGIVLIVTAAKMLIGEEREMKPGDHAVLSFFRRFVPITAEPRGNRFFSLEQGRWAATPLFATLLVIEASDLIFATDSIPAVLAISAHPFVIFTSNVFAILGLRALFFLISGIMDLFRFLRYGLACILFFIGAKMLLGHWVVIPIGASLGVVAFFVTFSILASLLFKESKPS